MSRFTFCLGILAVVVACGSSTEPGKARDPSLLFTNETSVPVYLTWQDGDAVVGRDTILPHAVNRCSRFLAQPDSAYFQIIATENGAQSTYTAPFFNPAERPAWSVTVSSDRTHSGSPDIVVQLEQTAC